MVKKYSQSSKLRNSPNFTKSSRNVISLSKKANEKEIKSKVERLKAIASQADHLYDK